MMIFSVEDCLREWDLMDYAGDDCADIYHSYTARIMRRIRQHVHPWALSQREQCTTAVTNLLPPLDNGLGALFHYLVIKGLTSDEIEEVARILDCMTTLEERYNNARPKGRHNVTREANRYVYALWRLKFPTLTEVSLSFSEGREAEITGFRSLIVDTWNSLDRVGQTLLLKNIKVYQLLVIHELGPLCHLLLSPHASDVLNTNYEETLVIERWMEHHLTKGMPAYEHRRKNRNYTTTYRMWGEKFETLPFHELRTEEAGHHWTPTAQEIHEIWEARLEDPTAPWYVSPAPERFPPLKTETPREHMPYEIMSVRSVPKCGRNAYERSEYRRRAKNNDSRKLRHVAPAGENRHPPNPTSNDQQPPSTSATHATPSPTAAASPSYKGSAQKSKGLSAQVSSPPVSKKKQNIGNTWSGDPCGRIQDKRRH